MATGSGKTTVMAMLISWHVLNKLAIPQDSRFSDTFLIVTPGITIRDRLRVLLPQDPQNYYDKFDLIPQDLKGELGKAKILITNFHAFLLHERGEGSKLTKTILNAGAEVSAFTETPDQMVRRVCRELGNKRNLVVINDEDRWIRHGSSTSATNVARLASRSFSNSGAESARRQPVACSKVALGMKCRRPP
jgi:type III restriction enzyme